MKKGQKLILVLVLLSLVMPISTAVCWTPGEKRSVVSQSAVEPAKEETAEEKAARVAVENKRIKDSILTEKDRMLPVKEQLLGLRTKLKAAKTKLHAQRDQYYQNEKAKYQTRLDDPDTTFEERKEILKTIMTKTNEKFGNKYTIERKELKPYFDLRDELRQKIKALQ